MSSPSEILKISRDYEHAVVDTGGRDTTSQRAALTVSDILLIPFAPRSFDIWTMDQVTSLVADMGAVNPHLRAFAFLNLADAHGQGSENADAAAMLRDNSAVSFLDAPLGRRKAFSHAATQGLAVTELTRPHRNQQAIDEIMTLFRCCFDVTVTSQAGKRVEAVR